MISLYNEDLKALKDLVISIHTVGASISAIVAAVIGDVNANRMDGIGNMFTDSYNELGRNIAICSIFLEQEIYKKILEFKKIA